MRWILLLIFLTSCLIALFSCAQGEGNTIFNSDTESDTLHIHERMRNKAKELSQFLANQSEYSDELAILIDMRQQSGKNRLFVFDMQNLTVLSKGLVAHGIGSETGVEDSLKFSNVPGSLCTSLGKYKIGAAYIGNFGRAYKLHGLEFSNDRAFERYVVLHSYNCVPDDEQTFPICTSEGCTIVSENYFAVLDVFIRNSEKPIILEVFY